MAKATKNDGPTKKAIEESEVTWSEFTVWMKWTVILVCVTLILLAAAFIR